MRNVAVPRPVLERNVKPLGMGKWYWVIVVTVLVSGLTAALYFGVRGGKAIPLIKWSHFQNAEEVSHAIQTRMSQELKPYQIYFIGPHPQKPLHIQAAINIVSWLKSQNSSVLIIDPILLEQNLTLQSLNPDLKLDLGREKERFLEGLSKVGSEQRIIVLAPNIYVTHLISESSVSQMQGALEKLNYITLSFMNFPGSRDQEKDFEFPCRAMESSKAGLDLGCFILGQSRVYYSKMRIEGKTPGFLSRVRSREYMFFLGN